MTINLTKEEVTEILLKAVKEKYLYAFKDGSGLDYGQKFTLAWNGSVVAGNDDGTFSFYVDSFELKKEKK